MLKVMQATFVTLQSDDEDIWQRGHQTFFYLYSHYFTGMLKVCYHAMSYQ